MRTIVLASAALAFVLGTGCKDRDHGDLDRADADEHVEATADQAGNDVDKAADETGNAVDSAADDVGDAAKGAGQDVKEAAKDVGDEFGATSYERRDEFRKEVDQRLAAMDKEIAELRQGINDNSTEAYRNSIAAVRDTRSTVAHDVDRLAGATEATWDDLKGKVWASLDSLDHQLRALRPDAKPMGGVGPS